MVAAFSVVCTKVHPGCMHVCVCLPCLQPEWPFLCPAALSGIHPGGLVLPQQAEPAHPDQHTCHSLRHAHGASVTQLRRCRHTGTLLGMWSSLDSWGSAVSPRSIALASRSCVLTGLQVALACRGVHDAYGVMRYNGSAWHCCMSPIAHRHCQFVLLLFSLLLQTDLFEIMYRCAKAFHERAYKKYLDAQVIQSAQRCLGVLTLHVAGAC